MDVNCFQIALQRLKADVAKVCWAGNDVGNLRNNFDEWEMDCLFPFESNRYFRLDVALF